MNFKKKHIITSTIILTIFLIGCQGQIINDYNEAENTNEASDHASIKLNITEKQEPINLSDVESFINPETDMKTENITCKFLGSEEEQECLVSAFGGNCYGKQNCTIPITFFHKDMPEYLIETDYGTEFYINSTCGENITTILGEHNNTVKFNCT